MTIDQNEPTRSGIPHKHIPVRSFEDESNLFLLQTNSGESRLGMCLQGLPTSGIGEETLDRMRAALSSPMPTDTYIQFGIISEPEAGWAIKAYMKGKKPEDGEFDDALEQRWRNLSPVMKRLAEGHATLVKDAVLHPPKGMNGVHVCRQRLLVTISVPCSTIPSQSEKDEVAKLGKKLQGGLASVGLFVEFMNDQSYLATIRRFFHLYEPDDMNIRAETELREQVFGPGDSVSFGNDTIHFNDGEYHAKILSVKHFPKYGDIGQTAALMGDVLGKDYIIQQPFWMCATLYYPDRDKTIAKVKQKFAWITNQQFGPLSHMIPALKFKKQGIDPLIMELESGVPPVALNFTTVIFARDEDVLEKEVEQFRAMAVGKQFELRADKRIIKPLFYSFLPLGTSVEGTKNILRFQTMAVSHAVRHLPFIGNYLGQRTSQGAMLLLNRRGTPFFFDPYHSETNHNGIIIAGSGSGKSFMGNKFCADMIAEGARVWVLDQGRSYEKLCKAHGGQFIEFSETSNICLNPFTKIENIDEEMEILKAMFAKMAAPSGGLEDFHMAALEEKLMAAYSKAANKASADTVYKMCLEDPDARVQDIGRQLYPFSNNGTYGRWFNGENNVDMNKDFVVLELKELENKKNLQQVVLIQLFSEISNAMYHTGHDRKKVMMVDEAWSLLEDPQMSKAIEIAYRTVRKHKGSAWLITQNIGDVYESPSGRAIVSSCEYKLIMLQKNEQILSAVDSGYLKLGISEMMQMQSLNTQKGLYADVMVMSTNGFGIGKLVVDRFSQIMFSTSGWERDEVMERMNAGEDVVEVINQYVMEGR